MNLSVELEESTSNVLIVDKHASSLSQKLKLVLAKYENKIFISPKIPNDLSKFNLCFLIDTDYSTSHLVKNSDKKIIFVLKNKDKTAKNLVKEIHRLSLKNVKVIVIDDYNLTDDKINNLLWFSFSKSKEVFLKISQPLPLKHKTKRHPASYSNYLLKMIKTFSLKKLFSIIFVFFLILHVLFLFPLLGSGFFFFQSVKDLKKFELAKTKRDISFASMFFNLSKKLYDLPHRTFLLFSIAESTDNLFQMGDKTILISNRIVALYENGQQIMKLLLKKDKTKDEQLLLSRRFNKTKSDLEDLNEELIFLNQKLPKTTPFFGKTKKELEEAIDAIGKVKKNFPQIDSLLAKDSEKKYLLLFANNMEIRPGGGFIGSFGIVTVKNYTLWDIKIYDVYDADGQLLAHVEPPPPIKKYLNQPHWFLRDSAFSPDFYENYTIAKSFLDKEMGISGFNGAILLTTSAIKNLLAAFGNIYLSGFNEVINSDNFYLKAQVYSEKNFFPGSTQKKSFLGALTRQLLLDLEDVSIFTLLQNLKKSLDEKQIVAYFEDQPQEEIVESFFWSGKIIQPHCPSNIDNCYIDYLFPIDANLGVNKSNFFVSKTMELAVSINKEGYLENTFTVKFTNNAQGEVFPGGTYKNYFQVYLPSSSLVKEITKNDVLVEDYDQATDQFKKIGFPFELKPKATAEIKIRYQSSAKLEKGKSIYQLLIQKQIGSSNNDLTLRLYLPKNFRLLNQNFSPLVKGNSIIYNTQLSADKIFFSELLSE